MSLYIWQNWTLSGPCVLNSSWHVSRQTQESTFPTDNETVQNGSERSDRSYHRQNVKNFGGQSRLDGIKSNPIHPIYCDVSFLRLFQAMKDWTPKAQLPTWDYWYTIIQLLLLPIISQPLYFNTHTSGMRTFHLQVNFVCYRTGSKLQFDDLSCLCLVTVNAQVW